MKNWILGFIFVISTLLVIDQTLADENEPAKNQPSKSRVSEQKTNPKPVQKPPKVQKGNIARSDITISETKDTLIKEYRIGGVLRAIKVTPKNGSSPYYLVDREGTGNFVRLGPDMGKELQPPQWVLFEW